MITGSSKNKLHRPALGLDPRSDVRVGIGNGVKFTRRQKLRGDIVTVAYGRLLGRESFQIITRLVFAPTPLQADVPFRILEIDADAPFPTGRQQIFVLLWCFVRSHQLCVIGHGVEQRMNVNPMAIGIFEAFIVGRTLPGEQIAE